MPDALPTGTPHATPPGTTAECDVDRDMRGKRHAHELQTAIADLAGRQHGVVARRQLAALGLSPDAIDRRLRAKRLLPLYRSVYAVGHRRGTRESAWMAAVLASGPGAVLSHRPAGAAWGVCGSGGPPEVTVARQRRPRPGIELHRGPLPADETTVHDGIPVTTVPRTIFDMASGLDLRRLERVVNEAEVLHLWDELSLVDLLDRYPRRPGARSVRAVLHARGRGATITRSELEVLCLAFADRFGFPPPETNVVIEGYQVDCVWREQRLIIEVDGWATHRTRAAFERDRAKSRALQAAGWRCIAVTYRQLTEGAHELARDVRRLLGAPGDAVSEQTLAPGRSRPRSTPGPPRPRRPPRSRRGPGAGAR
jgi:very-short-patch-repair endonuclease